MRFSLESRLPVRICPVSASNSVAKNSHYTLLLRTTLQSLNSSFLSASYHSDPFVHY